MEGGIPLRAGVHQQRGMRRDIAVPILPFAPPGDDDALGAGMIVAHHLQYRRAHLPPAPPAGRVARSPPAAARVAWIMRFRLRAWQPSCYHRVAGVDPTECATVEVGHPVVSDAFEEACRGERSQTAAARHQHVLLTGNLLQT